MEVFDIIGILENLTVVAVAAGALFGAVQIGFLHKRPKHAARAICGGLFVGAAFQIGKELVWMYY